VAAVALDAQPRPPADSIIAIFDTKTGRERVVYTAENQIFEAPNWSPDGQYLLLNSGGRLWRLNLAQPVPQPVDTGAVNRINNDHGISPDGKQYVISAGPMYVLPSTGGPPRQVTKNTPSYYHGWSPDGKTLVYCAPRNGNFDVYAIPVEGGDEVRLTSHAGYDDGPDYSPDGKWIYFNSDRSGSWDLWRIPAPGAGPEDRQAERVTTDDLEDWFPHFSPNGRKMVFLSFEKGTKGHPANQNVRLRLMDVRSGKIREIHRFFGGQGTINVNSWAPDSRRFAFVKYRLR
jgi:Tol biopolymer transport system component